MTNENLSDNGVQVVDPPFDGAGSTDETRRVGGVVLAAGTSSRFGERNKLLATVNDEPIVGRAIQPLVEAGVKPIVVVVGHEADAVRAAISDFPVKIVYNCAHASGQASSVRVGIAKLESNRRVDAAVVALGDMPFVHADTVEMLVSAYRAGVSSALAAAYDGVRGNPVLFDRQFFEDLTGLNGDTGGREVLLGAESAVLVEVGDRGVRRDVDDPTDLDPT